jgi:hypothetical protein
MKKELHEGMHGGREAGTPQWELFSLTRDDGLAAETGQLEQGSLLAGSLGLLVGACHEERHHPRDTGSAEQFLEEKCVGHVTAQSFSQQVKQSVRQGIPPPASKKEALRGDGAVST